MKKTIIMLALLGSVSSCVGIPSARVTTTIRVVTPSGEPVPDARVTLTYARVLETDPQENFEGQTNEFGEVRFSGRAESDIHVMLREPGFYGAYEKVSSHVFDEQTESLRFPDKTIELVAKEIRDPIVMIADGFFRLKLPEYDKEIGYDFFENDWVAPYGKGERADAYFEVTGYFNSFKDRKSWMTVRFANDGDGFIPFEANLKEGSGLRSDYLAPRSGYQRERTWRRGTRNGADDEDSKRGFESVENRGYYIRIRTELGEEGEVVAAHYGKIYGDFSFDGVWPRESGIVADSYYINPTPNDRNVEAVTKKTLIEGLEGLDLPRRP